MTEYKCSYCTFTLDLSKQKTVDWKMWQHMIDEHSEQLSELWHNPPET